MSGMNDIDWLSGGLFQVDLVSGSESNAFGLGWEPRGRINFLCVVVREMLRLLNNDDMALKTIELKLRTGGGSFLTKGWKRFPLI